MSRGDTQPWRLGKFYADSRFARGEGGKAFVHELVGLASQPCQVTDRPSWSTLSGN